MLVGHHLLHFSTYCSPIKITYLPADALAHLETDEKDAIDRNKLREDFAEMGQTLRNLDQRLITDGLYLSDRLLRIWERVKSTRADVSLEVNTMNGSLETDGLRYGDLHKRAQELEGFLDNARAACGPGTPFLGGLGDPQQESAAPRVSQQMTGLDDGHRGKRRRIGPP